MNVYRITTAKWADNLAGSGYPARWNSKGVYMAYTASSRALACLENLVHRSGEGLHNRFRIVEIEIPDLVSIQKIRADSLPEGWYKTGHYPTCRHIGDRWIEGGTSLLLEVPSSIIQEETNVLINPRHPEFSEVKIADIRKFRFDERL
ncbi:MAG: RES family NAD+ phosphorylase [Balneolaceae bacterium]